MSNVISGLNDQSPWKMDVVIKHSVTDWMWLIDLFLFCRKNVERRCLLDNMEGVFLIVDEIIDGGWEEINETAHYPTVTEFPHVWQKPSNCVQCGHETHYDLTETCLGGISYFTFWLGSHQTWHCSENAAFPFLSPTQPFGVCIRCHNEAANHENTADHMTGHHTLGPVLFINITNIINDNPVMSMNVRFWCECSQSVTTS